MKILSIQNTNSYTIDKANNRSSFNYCKLNQLQCDTISFSGLFANKKEKTPDVADGERKKLVKYEKTLIPKDGLSIYFSKTDKLSTNSPSVKKHISNLKNNQNIIIGRSFINPSNQTISKEHVSISRKGKDYYIEDRSLNGTTVFADSKYKNLDPNYLMQKYNAYDIDYMQYFKNKYSQIRRAKYDYETTFPIGTDIIQRAIDENDPKVDKLHQNSWVYRRFYNMPHKNGDEVERMSLNVVAHPSLIYALDNFFRTGEYFDEHNTWQTISDLSTINAYYKTPDNAINWVNRHDPITIYSCKPITPEFEKAIKSIASQYKRENCSDIPLCGALSDTPYVSHEKEASENQLKILLDRACKTGNKNLMRAINNYCFNTHPTGEQRFRASTGMLLAIEMILDEYEEYAHLRIDRN